jgi:hypothetical protein
METECPLPYSQEPSNIHYPEADKYNTKDTILQLGYLVSGGSKYRNLALQVGGVSEVETINYAHESRGTQI